MSWFQGAEVSWFWSVIIFLCLTFSSSRTFSEASHYHHQKQLPTAVVVGTVYCDASFQQDFHKASHFIPGASVAVECKEPTTVRPSFRQEVKTDEHGQFEVHLPFTVSKRLDNINNCSVSLIRSNEPNCSVAADATSSSFRLKSRKQGTHIFSAGFLTFKPLLTPCPKKGTPARTTNLKDERTFFPLPIPPKPLFPFPPSPFLPPPITLSPPPPPTTHSPPPTASTPSLPPSVNAPLSAPTSSQAQNLKDKKVNRPAFPVPPNPFWPFQPTPFLPPNPFLPTSPPSVSSPAKAPTPPQTQNLKDKKVRQPAFLFPPKPFLPSPPNPFLPPSPFLPQTPPSISAPATAPTPSKPHVPKSLPFPFLPIPGFPGVPPPAKVAEEKAP